MPKRTDISTILIIGAGPIVIGQACEFDYSGTQAVKTLKEEGFRIVLVNSNPATIMTDPELADATYIEPITPDIVEQIIARESRAGHKIDALLPTMGGQTALNTAMALARSGVLARYGVELIGASEEAIAKAEDRRLFRLAMDKIGLHSPQSRLVDSLDAAMASLETIGLPAIVRPSFTLGGTGGGIAYNTEDFAEIVRGGLRASPVAEVLIEESVLGWKEYELAVGYTLDELDNEITGVTPASFEPTIDYVVTKMPRFTFEKFPGAEPLLSTSMKSVGEAMAIGRSFGESVQKALRSMETGLDGFDEVAIPGVDGAGPEAIKAAVKAALAKPSPDRLLLIAQAYRHGLTTAEIHAACRYDGWFLERIGEIVAAEERVRQSGLPTDPTGFLRLKQMGFSDARLARLTDIGADDVAAARHRLGLHPVYKRIDTCAGEFPSLTPYMYSCYEGDGNNPP